MDRHEIYMVNRQKKVKVYRSTANMVRRCICQVLETEGLDEPHEVGVTFVCDRQIRRINREQRGKDAATDVLSFPVLEYDSQHRPLYAPGDRDGEAIMLGDIVISLERCQAQAQEFGHSENREVAYLTVHSMYHLLGYDHMTEEDKREMRAKEEAVLQRMGITRED
ncbi:MAG: rRNA maturation RNase YbeY [Eubacteriales bacterium]|jgi:probable rRNA maturation factor